MKAPIIEVRQENLFVLMGFSGVFSGVTMKTRHNLRNNKTCYVVDSNGDLWSFVFLRTNNIGIRRFVSSFWNISHDEYSFKKEDDISIGRFREIIEPHQGDLSPDSSEMALTLLESVVECDPSDPLRSHVHLLNL